MRRAFARHWPWTLFVVVFGTALFVGLMALPPAPPPAFNDQPNILHGGACALCAP